MKTRLEADASYLSARPLSLQERTQIEIEGALLRKEEDVRGDFDAAFRQHPQVLVEMVSSMRRYGDVDMMRNLVFAAETLYGDKLRALPGGIEFWEDLKREVAPLPHPPALTPSDLRIQRLQAIEIFRETIVSYDILSEPASPTPVEGHSAAEPVPTSPAGPEPVPPSPTITEPVPAAPEPDEVAPDAPPPAAEALMPQPASPAGPEPSAAVPPAPVEPSAASQPGPPPDDQARRIENMMLRIKQQEEALKRDCDGLLSREQKLLSQERELEQKEKAILESEGRAGRRLAGSEEELARLRTREAELLAELARTREQHQRTAGDLELALRQAADGAASAEALKAREEALYGARQKADDERAGLKDLQERLKAEEDRLRDLARELDQRSAQYAETEARQARLELADRELAIRRTELDGRETALKGTERTLREQQVRLEEDRLRLEAEKLAPVNGPVPVATVPRAPAATLSPPPQQPPASVWEGGIISRQATLAAAPTPTMGPPDAGELARTVRSPAPLPEVAPAGERPIPPPEISPPEDEAPERQVLYKVKCPGCKNIIPVFTRERPLKIKCDACGKEGVLK